jgi:hypothetical protein
MAGTGTACRGPGPTEGVGSGRERHVRPLGAGDPEGAAQRRAV